MNSAEAVLLNGRACCSTTAASKGGLREQHPPPLWRVARRATRERPDMSLLPPQVPAEVAFEDSDSAADAWRSVPALGLHPHAWVRTAAARLLGAAFAHPCVGEAFAKWIGNPTSSSRHIEKPEHVRAFPHCTFWEPQPQAPLWVGVPWVRKGLLVFWLAVSVWLPGC